MKLNVNNNRTTTFGKLQSGDVFRCNQTGRTFQKVSLKEKDTLVNCVDLESGSMYLTLDTAEVLKAESLSVQF